MSKDHPTNCRHCGAADDTPHLVTCAFVQFSRKDLETGDTFTHYDLTPDDKPLPPTLLDMVDSPRCCAAWPRRWATTTSG
jgi:hypothetical protein